MQNGCSQYSPSYKVTVPCREGEELQGGNMEAFIYPNPASETTTISFLNSEEQQVTVELLDVQGKLLETILTPTLLPEGNQQINYSVASLSKGVYLVRVASANQSRVIRMVCM